MPLHIKFPQSAFLLCAWNSWKVCLAEGVHRPCLLRRVAACYCSCLAAWLSLFCLCVKLYSSRPPKMSRRPSPSALDAPESTRRPRRPVQVCQECGRSTHRYEPVCERCGWTGCNHCIAQGVRCPCFATGAASASSGEGSSGGVCGGSAAQSTVAAAAAAPSALMTCRAPPKVPGHSATARAQQGPGAASSSSSTQRSPDWHCLECNREIEDHQTYMEVSCAHRVDVLCQPCVDWFTSHGQVLKGNCTVCKPAEHDLPRPPAPPHSAAPLLPPPPPPPVASGAAAVAGTSAAGSADVALFQQVDEYRFCTACGRWADQQHLNSKKHRDREQDRSYWGVYSWPSSGSTS